MDVQTATGIAMNTPSGSPPYYVAEALCRMRGKDPWAMETPTGLVNWQLLIAESLLMQTLVEMAASAQLGRSICFPYGGPQPEQRNADDMGMPFASGTLTEGGDVKQAPGDSLCGPTPKADAHE